MAFVLIVQEAGGRDVRATNSHRMHCLTRTVSFVGVFQSTLSIDNLTGRMTWGFSLSAKANLEYIFKVVQCLVNRQPFANSLFSWSCLFLYQRTAILIGGEKVAPNDQQRTEQGGGWVNSVPSRKHKIGKCASTSSAEGNSKASAQTDSGD